MPLPTNESHGLLEPIVTVVIAACSAVFGALTMAFTSGKRYQEILSKLAAGEVRERERDKRFDRLEDRINKHFDKV